MLARNPKSAIDESMITVVDNFRLVTSALLRRPHASAVQVCSMGHTNLHRRCRHGVELLWNLIASLKARARKNRANRKASIPAWRVFCLVVQPGQAGVDSGSQARSRGYRVKSAQEPCAGLPTLHTPLRHPSHYDVPKGQGKSWNTRDVLMIASAVRT